MNITKKELTAQVAALTVQVAGLNNRADALESLLLQHMGIQADPGSLRCESAEDLISASLERRGL